MIMNWAYIGGFFDGEGTLHIDGASCKAEMYQKDLPTLENIKRFLDQEGIGSRIFDYRHHDGGWRISLQSKRDVAEKFMRSILPYVERKRTVIQDGLRYQKLFPPMPYGPRP